MTPGATWPCGPQPTRPRSVAPAPTLPRNPPPAALARKQGLVRPPNSDLPVNPGGPRRSQLVKTLSKQKLGILSQTAPFNKTQKQGPHT